MRAGWLAAIFLAVNALNLALAQDRIKIGVPTALSGNAATYGTDLKNTVIFANRKLANGRYELVFEDDRCNGRDAVAAAHRLVDVVGVKYVLGFACSSTLLSTAPIYEKARVIAITPSASAAAIAQAGEYIYRTWSSDDLAGEVLIKQIAKETKILGVISEQTDYAQGFLNSVRKAAPGENFKIVNIDYISQTQDYRSLLMKLRDSGADGLFINSQDEATFLNIAKQARQLNWPVKIFSAYWAGTNEVLTKGAALVEGSEFVDLPGADELMNEEGKTLYQEFIQEFGGIRSMSLLFTTTLEAFRALDLAIQSGKDPRDFLNSNHFQGVIGEWSFDSNGEIVGLKPIMKKIVGGKPVTL